MKLKQKRGFIIGAAVAGALATTGGALAAIPDSTSGVITSCYDTTGAVKVIDKAATTCPSGTTQLQWNQQGRTGPTGPRGPQGQSGDNRTFWVHLGAKGEALGSSGSNTYGGYSGTGTYWIIADKTWVQDMTKCAITASPAVTSMGGMPVSAMVYYPSRYYAYALLKTVKRDAWPLQDQLVDGEVFIVANCGQTQ